MVTASGLEEIVLRSEEVMTAIARLANSEGSEQRLSTIAKSHFSDMRADINPQVLEFGAGIANLAVNSSFTSVEVSGQETAAQALSRGAVALFSTHFSYMDVAVLPNVFAKNNVADVYYVAGENIAHVPVIGAFANRLFKNSGAVFVKRDLSAEGKSGLVFHAVLQAYVAHLLSEDKNVLNFAGRGRHKTGEVERVDSTASQSILTKAEAIVPVAITYDIIPDDRLLALSRLGRRRKGSSILEAIKLIRLDKFYGTVYVNFGKPLNRAAYADRYGLHSSDPAQDLKPAVRQFHRDVTESIIRLVTLTPVNALAAVLSMGSSGNDAKLQPGSFRLEDLTGQVQDLVGTAAAAGVKAFATFPGYDLNGALSFASEKLTRRGALSHEYGVFSVQEPRLLAYYSKTIHPTLLAFGVVQQN